MSHTTSLERRRRHPPWRFGSAGLGPSGGEPSPPHRSGKNTGKKPLAGGLAERVYRAVSPRRSRDPVGVCRFRATYRARATGRPRASRSQSTRDSVPGRAARGHLGCTREQPSPALPSARRYATSGVSITRGSGSSPRGRWLEVDGSRPSIDVERDVEHPRSSSRGGRSTRQVIHGPATDIPPPTTSGHFCHRRTICPGIEQKARRSGDGFWPPQAR